MNPACCAFQQEHDLRRRERRRRERQLAGDERGDATVFERFHEPGAGSGFDALPDQPHRGQVSQLTPALLAALRELIASTERTWTARQLADWLAEHHDVHFSRDHLGFLLRRAGLTYKRTERHLQHTRGGTTLTQRARLRLRPSPR